MSRNQAPRSSFSFGLGCLQFLPATPVKDMMMRRYSLDLDAFLRTIPAIADIHIDPGFDLEACWHGPSPLPGDNEYIWTETDLEIKMSLHIPSRVQEELKEGLSLETDAQDFHLTIKHAYYAPVAIITSDAESGRSSGSSNVYLVRNFLDKILKERKSVGFVLDYIGPSPFHADFGVRKLGTGEAPDLPVVMTQNVRPGYNEIVWHVDTKQIAFDRAIAEILDGIRDDADLFYHIVQSRNALLRAWVEASQLASEVTDLEQEKSLRRRIRSHALKSRRIKDAIMSVTEYQMLDIGQRSQLNSLLKDHN